MYAVNTFKFPGTGAAIDLDLGYVPAVVEVTNLATKARAKWTSSLVRHILTILATALPGAANLVFTSKADIDVFISVAFVDLGASGTSTLTITGSGTEDDPYVYSFGLYDDDNDNNAIIALLSGDSYLEASGADATAGASITYFDATPLASATLKYAAAGDLTVISGGIEVNQGEEGQVDGVNIGAIADVNDASGEEFIVECYRGNM